MPGADRLLGEPLRLVRVEVLVVEGRQRDDGLSLAHEPGEVRVLVLVPLAEDEVAVRGVELRLHDLAARGSERQRRQVRAGEMVGEVRRRQPQRPVVATFHGRSISVSAAAPYGGRQYFGSMEGIVRNPGEGVEVFGGRIVLKSTLPEICLTESWYSTARMGAEPHYHRHHADSFYVLEGEMAFLLHDEEHVLGPGDCVCAPPGVVHGFRSLSPRAGSTCTRRTAASASTCRA